MKYFQKMLAMTGLCLMLALIIAVGSRNGTAEAAGGGTFYLTASISSRTLIEPVTVSYKDGQTIKDALKASGYSFGNIDQFYITDIEGVAGNFTIYYDGGGYDLTEPASSITGIIFSERQDLKEADLTLMKQLAAFRESDSNVVNYPDAEKAYTSGNIALRQSGSDAEAIVSELQSAIQAYNALFDGTKYKVSVTASQDNKILTAPVITLTDAYGNQFTNTGSSISVIAGTYEFVVSDGNISTTEGTVKVTGNTDLSVTLPAGAWFKDFKLVEYDKVVGVTTDDEDFAEEMEAGAVKADVDLADGTATFYAPDTADEGYCLAYAVMGSVPDEDKTLFRVTYHKLSTDTTITTGISWESRSGSLPYLVQEGDQGASFTAYAQYTGDDGYIQKQTIRCNVLRTPTLTELCVNAEGSKLPLVYDAAVNIYSLSTVSDNVDITATGYLDSYTVNGTGHFVLDTSKDQNTINITVTNNRGLSNTYSITLKKVDSVPVTVSCPSGCSLKVYNSVDVESVAVNDTYHLIPGDTYYYICSKQDRYYTKASFKASSGLSVSATAPETVDAITAFRVYDAYNYKSRKQFTADSTFTPTVKDYTYTVKDSNSSVYAQVDHDDSYTVTLTYANMQSSSSDYGKPKTATISSAVSDSGKADNCAYLLSAGGYTQSAVLLASRTESDVTYYQEYDLIFQKELQLSALTAADTYGNLTFYDASGAVLSFNRSVHDYYINVDRTTSEVTASGTFYKTAGYSALVNETVTTDISELHFTLDPEKDTEDLTITLCHEDTLALNSTYTLHVTKTDPVSVTFKTTPENANVYLVNNATDRHISKKNGVYELVPGVSYTYTVTLTGYVSQSVTDYVGPSDNTTITVNLTKAEENTSLQDYSAKWPSFRADNYNNGVVDDPTPTSAEDSTLYWATQLGEGYSADACGCPIIVDGYLYTYAGTHIYKVDTVSGEVVASGDMDHKSSFAINSPTYAEGMIFVSLADGCVQAFNAATMESVWIYHDPLKGQPNCPIVYHDGYIYTGFWLGETTPANFVCLSVTDEDPSNTCEEKAATWRYTHNGYYWAGAYVCDDYLLIGTDDGASGYLDGHASILSLDPLTGDLIDSYTLKETGDQRSSITFAPDSEESNAGYGYFTTKGGYFYRIRVEADGTLDDDEVKALKLYNYVSDSSNPPMSTCTPTIYNNRAYVGVSGTGQYTAYSGHNITVIDLKHWTIAYTVRTQGYPQTSGLLTTAYEEETGNVYVYFFDNYTPGKLRMLIDHDGQTEPLTGNTSVESFTDKNGTTEYTTAYNLFTPYDAQAQYAICSPVTDEYGTIYFKNDSAYLMALGSEITKLEITTDPDNLDYNVGDVFDGTGMTVTATYANGKTRDVTKYVTWSTDPLTSNDTEFTIEFPYTMYHNENGEAGTAVEHPFATLSLNIGKEDGAPKFQWSQTESGMTCQAVFAAGDTASGTEETCDCEVSSENTKDATCTEKGLIVYTAKVTYNGKTYTKTKKVSVEALGHDYQTIAAKAPACTENGYSEYQKCSRCGDVINYEELKATGHSWDEGAVTKEATETETGTMLYTCTACGATKEEVIPVKEHQHVSESVSAVAATWTKAGKTKGTRCSICKTVLSGCKTVAKAGTPTLTATVYTYNGKAKCPTVKLTGLKKGTDYTVTYSNNVKVGKASVTIRLKGNYSGTKTMKFTIRPTGTAITKLTAYSKAFTAKWTKKSTQVTGYQLNYSLTSSMKNAKTKTVTSYKTTSVKVTGLTKKKVYYVRIRTYKTVSGVKYYSAWSAVKKVKVK